MAIRRNAQLCAKVRPHEVEAVKAIAAREGITVSELIREALSRQIKQGKALVDAEVADGPHAA